MAKVTPALKMKHSDLQNLIIGWLESRRCSVRNNNTTAIPDGKGGFRKNPSKGTPDLTACIHPEGKMFDVEVKVGKDKPSPEQLERLRETRCAGGLAIVAYSLEDVIQEYEKFKKQKDLINAIPKNWCDSLLTGENAVVGKYPFDCPDIERLLNAIRERMQKIINKGATK